MKTKPDMNEMLDAGRLVSVRTDLPSPTKWVTLSRAGPTHYDAEKRCHVALVRGDDSSEYMETRKFRNTGHVARIEHLG